MRGTGKTTLANGFAQQFQELGGSVMSTNLLSLSEQARYTSHRGISRAPIAIEIKSPDDIAPRKFKILCALSHIRHFCPF